MLMILQVKVSSAKNGREREREEEENGVHKNGEIEGEFLYHSLFRNLSYATRKRKNKIFIFFETLRLNPEEQSIIRLIAPLIEIAQEGAISTGTLLMGF